MASSQPPPPPGQKHQSDRRARTVLASTHNNLRTSSTQQADLDLSSDEYLDKVEEQLNQRVDQDVLALVEGIRELVALQRIDPSQPPPLSLTAHRALSTRLRTESMLKNAHSLLSLAHTLKLLHLFGDQQAGEEVREQRDRELRGDIDELKQRAEQLARAG